MLAYMTMNNSENTPAKVTTSRPVVLLTVAAVEKVRSMMLKENKLDYGLRVGVVTGGCAGLSYEMRLQKTAYNNDRIIEQDGLMIFINEESVAFLNGIEIDYTDTLKESGFKYKNPNAKSSCGCGTSFS
ncbi:MAG: iron-sulfur cluster assembly accessory protein [Candidatus Omnitrophica bacterium]|nr:iron-sulfur cluster assembly accessory protein [Candidatus Omnitrophota bacterium]